MLELKYISLQLLWMQVILFLVNANIDRILVKNNLFVSIKPLPIFSSKICFCYFSEGSINTKVLSERSCNNGLTENSRKLV